MIINILVDNPKSWIVPYAMELKRTLERMGNKVNYYNDAKEIKQGELSFFLSCEKMVPEEILAKSKHNLVVHESALPKGKGMSPLTWQILEGKNDIPITLFEAAEKVDSGSIYLQKVMPFHGHELINELREVQGNTTMDLIVEFVKKYPNVTQVEQKGDETFYPRRWPQDSELDVNKSIREQFNLLRVVDNERYPGFFNYLGYKYIIKIEKAKYNDVKE
jgi:methionyl-tRNA formyltransferase